MRQMRLVSAAEFERFVAAYDPPLTSTIRDDAQHYEDLSTGETYPDSLVASYLLPNPPARRRSSGYRIPITPED